MFTPARRRLGGARAVHDYSGRVIPRVRSTSGPVNPGRCARLTPKGRHAGLPPIPTTLPTSGAQRLGRGASGISAGDACGAVIRPRSRKTRRHLGEIRGAERPFGSPASRRQPGFRADLSVRAARCSKTGLAVPEARRPASPARHFSRNPFRVGRTMTGSALDLNREACFRAS